MKAVHSRRPIQFSLRLTLVFMALVAVACWWIWSPVYYHRVSLGMSKEEVNQSLGSPWDVWTEDQTDWWSYPRNLSGDYDSGELLIRFGFTGEVVEIRRLPPMRIAKAGQ